MTGIEQNAVQVTETFVDHPQGRLFVRNWDGGSGAAPILLLHDSLGCVELWRGFPAALAQALGRRVIAYDRLGFGRSDPRAGALTPAFIEEEARTVLPLLQRALGFRPFIAFGHSVGGGMAVHCAALQPGECVALITESAQAFVEERTRAGIRDARAGFRDPAQLARLARYHGDKARWVLDAWTETWLSPAFAAWSLDGVLPRVRCPLLALHGEHDEFGSPRHPETLARLAAGPTRIELIAGAFHVPHREQAALVVRHVRDFLSALRA